VLSGVPFIVVSRPHVMKAIPGLLAGVISHQVHDHGGTNAVARLLDRSVDLEVLGRFLPAIAHDLILHDLPLIEGAQSGTLDRGNMDEHVLAATLRLNESISFGRIEPLDRPFGHLRLLALYPAQRSRITRCSRSEFWGMT